MNTVLNKKNTVEPDLIKVREMSDNLHIHRRLAELLISRGIDTEKAVSRFLHPSEDDFYDPFMMKGMRDAVERIKVAMTNGERILIYGDYDADGVCSSAILSLYFKSRGCDSYVHIPNRINEGYGLNVNSIESIIEEVSPDLIVTCDCGISGIDEVEHCLDLGVDIIVTDHHEPGSVLPNCVVVNPKQSGDEYPDKLLCGAGVALKLVQALGGDAYLEYIDLAAVATIADLVALRDENRLIVQLGLKILTDGNGNIGLKRLLRSQGLSGKISSSDIAYKIAPRINAAGRMGDAFRAFEILTTSDEKTIDELIGEIEKDNERRKEVCDEIYAEAETDLTFENIVDNRAIVLVNPSWMKGVTGIAAARFAGDYNRPAFIIVDRSEEKIYKGTARGIAGINIYDALSYCSDLLVEFGGHPGAAGFAVHEDNIEAFRVRINEYMAKQPEKYFVPSVSYDLDVDESECDKSFLSAMEMLEPTGYGNTKPLLCISAKGVKFSPCKNPQHSQVHIGALQTFAFYFYNKNQFLMGSDEKKIVLELTEGLNGGVSGYIKSVVPSELYINDELAAAAYLSMLSVEPADRCECEYYKDSELRSLLPGSIYGTLFVCADRESYNKTLALGSDKFVTHDYMFRSEKNNYSGIIVAPSFDESSCLGNYDKIVFVDAPPSEAIISRLNKLTKARIFVPESKRCRLFDSVSTDRNVFAKYYSAIVSHAEAANKSVIVFYKRFSQFVADSDPLQFVFCLAVFKELGFITLSGDGLKVNKDVHRSLNESAIYRSAAKES